MGADFKKGESATRFPMGETDLSADLSLYKGSSVRRLVDGKFERLYCSCLHVDVGLERS